MAGIASRGEEHRRHLGQPGQRAQGAQRGDAAHVGQVDVEQKQPRRAPRGERQRLAPLAAVRTV